MFEADKDRKLGGRRGPQRRGGGRDGRDEFLEKARRERAQREKLRMCKVQAVTIQRWYRGRSAAAASRASERMDWDRKLSDFKKLQKTLLSRGIPFTPPVKFVLASLQQLLFFFRMQEDSGRFCLFCEVVLTSCVLQPDPALNPVAHLLGVHDAGGAESKLGTGKGDRGDRDDAPARQALRCRLKRLLAACLAYGGKELNKGVAEGNFPVKVLLMLIGYPEYTGTSDDAPGPTITAAAVQTRSTISRGCMEVLVFELNLIHAMREVMLGNDSERQGIASAGIIATPRPTPGRRGAMLSWWKMALHMLDSVNTLCPPHQWGTDSSVTVGSWCRGSFVVEVLSVPLLPSRLGSDGINLLLKERRATFVNCLRDFRMLEEVRGGVGDGDGALYGVSGKDGNIKAATSNTISAPMAIRMPPSPVSCCSSETFLLGNLSALGTRFSMFDGAEVAVVGEGGSAVDSKAIPARELEEFLRAVTALLEMKTIPDSLLTDRQAITWKSVGEDGGGKSGGTSMIAMAVPQSVQDQVRLLVSDRWIRVASRRAMEGINEARLRRRTEAERIETKENLESSAAALAMASVRSQQAEANRGFVSKWAEKLRQSSKRWFRAENLSALAGYAMTGAGTAAASPPMPPSGSGSGLIDSSVASRAAAEGKLGRDEGGGADGGSEEGQGGYAEEQKQNCEDTPHDYDAEIVQALCDFLEVLLRRWGTGIHASNPVVQGLLNTLCFSLPCVARLWAFIFNECGGTVEDSCSPVERLCGSVPLRSPTGGGLYSGIAVVCCLFGHMLVVLDDFELYEAGQPLPLHHVRALVKGLKGPLFKFCWEVEPESEDSHEAVTSS